jgi:hypothetical protein
MPLSGRLLNACGAMSPGTPICHTPIGCIDSFPNRTPLEYPSFCLVFDSFPLRPTTMRGLAVRPFSYKCT